MNKGGEKWRLAVDRGGTFTDIVGLDPSGTLHSFKLLSSSPAYPDSSVEGIRRMIGLGPDEQLPFEKIERIRFGTTVATNALLERKGCKTALLISKGFRDLLEIGNQNRPDIFQLCIQKSRPLYSAVIEVDERLNSRGETIRAVDTALLSAELTQLKQQEIEAVAVVLMHSWKNPSHELACEKLLKEQGYSAVFLSHRTVNLIKIISRGQSTVVDAYLSAVLARYLEGIENKTGPIPLEFMESSGVLAVSGTFTGKNAILSGPAGGVVAVATIAEDRGLRGVIGFDMGGTSTDVSRYDGRFERVYERTIAGIPLQTEMLDIITVAAGGGSLLKFDGQKMTVGPDSAGSNPGPACYGFGGPLTVTDANLLTGRLMPAYFPRAFGSDGTSGIDKKVVKDRFASLTEEINRTLGTTFTLYEVAAGFLRIANENMALAVKKVSVSRGFDVREYALVCFGGAGGQHACSIATLLDIETVIIHPLSSVMSAYGIGLAKPARKSSCTVLRTYSRQTHDKLPALLNEMKENLMSDGAYHDSSIKSRYDIDLRPQGAETFLTVEYDDYDKTLSLFKQQYTRLFGFSLDDTILEVVNLRVEIMVLEEYLTPYVKETHGDSNVPVPDLYHTMYYASGPQEAEVYRRESLSPLSTVPGPACIVDNDFSVIIDPGFEARTDDNGIIVIKRKDAQVETVVKDSALADPVLLEVFNNLFMGIAEEMGLTLRNTAYSVNMKERLDFSCAIFDGAGDLVANAPHIPVHLGAMADTVKALIEARGKEMKPGNVYLSNDPYRGGSHLPDMTVISPVFSFSGNLMFYTAARGHHSDVGGTTPGSMPPSASHIDEEGVLIRDYLLVRNGKLQDAELKELLENHAYPVRNCDERLFDFRAQIAACHKGASQLNALIVRYGLNMVRDYMGHIQSNSEFSVKKALFQLLKNDNHFESNFEDCLDDGTVIKVHVSIDGGQKPPETLRAVIDFTGTGEQHLHDNLNAPQSVARSAVIYVLRSLIDGDIPLNSGCLNPVDIIIPEGTILSPLYPAPVASGNVETSQRVVDVLLGALGVAAASQGTMNNLLFEVKGEAPYYETIAGGAGALNGCSGASGVQVHMTNTRITDPEVLEFRHPGIRLDRFTLRRGSGGKGAFPGGDGVIREIAFLKPSTVSIISERRVSAPYGLQGGGAGEKGINQLRKARGEKLTLKNRELLKLDAGDSIIISTPGGGGFGKGKNHNS